MKGALSILFAIAGCATATAADAQIRASLAKQDEIWVGQRVVLVVELLAPGTFASAAAFDLPSVPGVIFIPPAGSPLLGSETIDDVSYTSQRHEVAIYAQRAGKISIPSFTVRFESTPEFDKPSVSHRLKTSPLEFRTKLPPGAEGFSVVITTSRMQVTQKWAPNLEQVDAKPGDAFTRTITLQADDVPAMVLPALSMSAPDGIRVYAQPAAIEAHSNRGQSTGQRVEKLTYVCEQPGDYTLPALAFAWWDPAAKILHQEVLPEVSWKVLEAAPDQQKSTADTRRNGSKLAFWAILFAGLAFVAASTCLVLWWNKTSGDAEKVLFAAFQRACRQDNPIETLSTFRDWFHQIKSDQGGVNVEREVSIKNPELIAQIRALQSIAFGRPGQQSEWSAATLHRLANQQRKLLLRQANRSQSDVLPPLNPLQR